MNSDQEYVAFISYRHTKQDKRIAGRIRSLIENYKVPKALQAEYGGTRLGKVFQDEAELPASSNLSDNIEKALDHSRFLIVICSPDTPQSQWVRHEILYFLKNHGHDHIIAVLVSDIPDNSFPPEITTEYSPEGTPLRNLEPLAANLTSLDHKYAPGRLRKEIVRIYAAIMNCSFDSLWQRERRQRVIRTAVISAAALSLVLAFTVNTYIKNRQITQRNIQIEQQNQEITAQNRSLEEKESHLLIQEGKLLLEKGNLKAAADNAVKSVADKTGRETYAADGEYLLSKVLNTGIYQNRMRTSAVIEQNTYISEMELSESGDRLYTLDDSGAVRCFSTEDGALIWRSKPDDHSDYSIVNHKRIQLLEDQNKLILLDTCEVTSFSLSDGSVLWSYKPESLFSAPDSDLSSVTPDGKTVIFIDRENSNAALINAEDGSVTSEIPTAGLSESHLSLSQQTTAVSRDSRYAAFSYLEDGGENEGEKINVIWLDLQEEKNLPVPSVKIAPSGDELRSLSSFILGMSIVSNNKDSCHLLLLYYDDADKMLKMVQINKDGTSRETSALPLDLVNNLFTGINVVHTYNEYLENGFICASIDERSFTFFADGTCFTDHMYQGSNPILHSEPTGDSAVQRIYLSNDGHYNAYYDGGLEGDLFSDRIHISKLDITKGFAVSRKEDFGFELNGDSVEAIICDDNEKTVYILRPARGPEIHSDSYASSDSDNDSISFCDGNRGFIFGESGSGGICRAIDTGSHELIKEYKLEPEFSEGDFMSDHAHIWPDGRHFTYDGSSFSPVIYDLETNTSQPVFSEDIFPYAFNCITVRQNSGEILSAAFGKNKDNRPELVWKEGDSETRRATLPENDYEYPRIGSNGYIYLRTVREKGTDSEGTPGNDSSSSKGETFSEDDLLDADALFESIFNSGNEDTRESGSYVICSTSTGEIREIHDECPGNVMRDVFISPNDHFASFDDDGMLRIYDNNSDRPVLKLQITNEEVKDVSFSRDDRAVIVWTEDHVLRVYSMADGNLLYEELTGINNEGTLTLTEDPDRSRLYIYFPDLANWEKTNGICLDTNSWKKTADLNGMTGFNSGTNEIYCKNPNGTVIDGKHPSFIRYTALTLDEMTGLVNGAD
ncbi:MAG: TIR domain-containing protein [Lachnospiraceae bacterium]|nr:TIR domain-containing protein [Lachnospiraceae bacterium]